MASETGTVKYRIVHPAADIGRRFTSNQVKRGEIDKREAKLEQHYGSHWTSPSAKERNRFDGERNVLEQQIAWKVFDAFARTKDRSAEEVREMLKGARRAVAFIGKLRLFDITGSSNDLPQWQIAFSKKVLWDDVDLKDRFGEWAKGFPTLSACCSTLPVRLEIRYSDKPNSIVFNNLAYGTRTEWDFSEKPSVPIGKLSLAPFYILGNYFGLRGIEIISHETSPIAKCGGLESSNAFVYGLHWLGTVLTGSGDGQAEIFSRAVFDANNTLGDLTGGQGMSAMIEGGYHTFHYLVGAGMNGYISQEIVKPSDYKAIYGHIDLVQPGKDFGADYGRSAADINNGWCAALATPEGFNEQSRIPELAIQFAKALNAASEGDENAWREAAMLANAQVDIRVNRGPKYLQGNEDFAAAVRDMGGAAFALGAGGPGAMFAVLGPSGLTQQVRARFGLMPVTEQVATEVLKSSGKLKGFIEYQIDEKGMEYEGVEEAGFGPTPVRPLELEFNL